MRDVVDLMAKHLELSLDIIMQFLFLHVISLKSISVSKKDVHTMKLPISLLIFLYVGNS